MSWAYARTRSPWNGGSSSLRRARCSSGSSIRIALSPIIGRITSLPWLRWRGSPVSRKRTVCASRVMTSGSMCPAVP